MMVQFTDQSVAGIKRHAERQLAKADIVTLTRGQWTTLLGVLNAPGYVEGFKDAVQVDAQTTAPTTG